MIHGVVVTIAIVVVQVFFLWCSSTTVQRVYFVRLVWATPRLVFPAYVGAEARHRVLLVVRNKLNVNGDVMNAIVVEYSFYTFIYTLILRDLDLFVIFELANYVAMCYRFSWHIIPHMKVVDTIDTVYCHKFFYDLILAHRCRHHEDFDGLF